MAKALIVLNGRLGNDPPSVEDKVYKLSVACDGNKKDETSWFNVVIWDDKIKEFVSKYFKKGYTIIVSGVLTTSKVNDEKGTGYWINVSANSVQFGVGGSKKEEGDSSAVEEKVKEEDIKF